MCIGTLIERCWYWVWNELPSYWVPVPRLCKPFLYARRSNHRTAGRYLSTGWTICERCRTGWEWYPWQPSSLSSSQFDSLPKKLPTKKKKRKKVKVNLQWEFAKNFQLKCGRGTHRSGGVDHFFQVLLVAEFGFWKVEIDDVQAERVGILNGR